MPILAWGRTERLNDPMNKMILPTVEGAQVSTTTRTVHQGRHFDQYSEELAKEMTRIYKTGERAVWTKAQYRAELENLISKTRAELKNGEVNLNKHTKESLGLPMKGDK